MPKIKRESRQFIVINEEKLITEVQKRPILYDKALRGYRKPAIREGAWHDVAVELESTVDECKKRWRSLRDAFMKQLKLNQRDDSSIKKRWLFYEHMEFLAPFFDNIMSDVKFDIDEEYIEAVNSGMETVESSSINKITNSPINQHIVCISHEDGDYQPHHIEIDEYNEEQLDDEDEETTATIEHVTTSTGKSVKSENNVYILKGTTSNVTTNNEMEQMSSRHSKTDAHSYTNDPDERFLLSCLPILKRMPNKKNSLARLKIQQLLFNIEFEDYVEGSGQ